MASLWQESASLPSFKRLSGNVKCDVLIIGGGMAGLLLGHMLKERGIDYLIVEAKNIAGGITKNTTAKITAQHGLFFSKLSSEFGREKASLYLEANTEAIGDFERLSESIDCGFERKDAFVYSLDDRRKIEREFLALDKAGFSAEFQKDLPLPFSVAGAVKFKNQAQFNPLKFLSGISKDLNVFENTRVRELIGETAVTSGGGKIEAKRIVVATHFPFINKHGSYFLKMYQHRSYVLALENAPDLCGMYLDENEKGLSFRNYEDLLLVGGGSHRTGKKGGGYNELSEFVRKSYPQARVKYQFATQDCMTLDKAPYIGHYSKNTPNLFVAAGFNKWGMTSSMVSAKILADMLEGKHNRYEEVFSPSRTILRPQLAVNGAQAVLNLLTPTAPRCPHMGCALKWNPDERSWDCPCHGSRFEENGKQIDNPATGDLKR